MNDPFNVFANAHLQMMFRDRFQADLQAAYVKHFPKRKKVNLGDLPEEIVSAIKTKWQEHTLRVWDREMAYYPKLIQWLDGNAQYVDLTNDWQVAYKSEAYKYSTQTNPMGYALGDVKRKAEKLNKFNLHYEIRRFGYDPDYNITFDNLQSYRYGQEWARKEKGYCLFAPVAPYQLDAIERMSRGSLLDLAVSCWKAGQNPRVAYPFLPNSIFDESMEIVYGRKNQS